MAPKVAPELHPRDGFWGKPTSTINFCEENYVMSYYVAEFCKRNSTRTLSAPYLSYPYLTNTCLQLSAAVSS